MKPPRPAFVSLAWISGGLLTGHLLTTFLPPEWTVGIGVILTFIGGILVGMMFERERWHRRIDAVSSSSTKAEDAR